MGGTAKITTLTPLSCTECHRRKQKCSRNWPCDRCQKRKASHECRFSHHTISPEGSSQGLSHKRKLRHDKCSGILESSPWIGASLGFLPLEYPATYLFGGSSDCSEESLNLTTSGKQYFQDATSCYQLQRALQLLTPRHHTDNVVQNFFSHSNFHFYIIYPPLFLEQYSVWWRQMSRNQSLSLQWTCLLLMVCACSTQYADAELKGKLELDFGISIRNLSEQYHQAARELQSVIPLGDNHLFSVQSSLHSCSWYMSECRFAECWHALNAAVREGQELGFHRELVPGCMAEFDHEMRRRVWCVLNSWDWQLSALLSRPMVVDRAICTIGFPSLALDERSPSPLLHMKLQSELIEQLSHCFGQPRNISQPVDVQWYQSVLEEWMRNLPPVYDIEKPDKRMDVTHAWIALHRHYLQTISYSMALCPMKSYLAKPMSSKSPPNELKIRRDGIDYSLKLMEALRKLVHYVYPPYAKLYLIPLNVFDTAAVLCSAIIHDQDGSIPRRQEILYAVKEAVAILKDLTIATSTTRVAYEVLLKLIKKIPQFTPTTITASIPSRVRTVPKECEQITISASRLEAPTISDSKNLQQQTPCSILLTDRLKRCIETPQHELHSTYTSSNTRDVDALFNASHAGLDDFERNYSLRRMDMIYTEAMGYSAPDVKVEPHATYPGKPNNALGEFVDFASMYDCGGVYVCAEKCATTHAAPTLRSQHIYDHLTNLDISTGSPRLNLEDPWPWHDIEAGLTVDKCLKHSI